MLIGLLFAGGRSYAFKPHESPPSPGESLQKIEFFAQTLKTFLFQLLNELHPGLDFSFFSGGENNYDCKVTHHSHKLNVHLSDSKPISVLISMKM